MFHLLFSLFITIIIWLFNLEKGNGMGNVWLRPNDKGQIVFAYRSLIKLLIEPFRNLNMWSITNWDINFYIIFLFVFTFSFLFKKLDPIS